MTLHPQLVQHADQILDDYLAVENEVAERVQAAELTTALDRCANIRDHMLDDLLETFEPKPSCGCGRCGQ